MKEIPTEVPSYVYIVCLNTASLAWYNWASIELFLLNSLFIWVGFEKILFDPDSDHLQNLHQLSHLQKVCEN